MLRKRRYFVSGKIHPGHPSWSVQMGKFSSRLPRLGQTCFSYKHIEVSIKERVARRDLGNRASPIARAHVKRPLEAREHLELVNY